MVLKWLKVFVKYKIAQLILFSVSYTHLKIVADLCSINKNLMYSMDIISIPTDEAVTETENRLLGIATNIANYSRKQAANNNFAGSIPCDINQHHFFIPYGQII